ncbi:MAG: peptidylprolyl isomerase [Paludibacteraceae bacterium]|nr:peptidylprolyl isomerase [Paludibacteraceae bacterium]
MKKIALILSSLIVCSSIVAQTLLTINDKEISKQEFEYYYNKNNHIESDTLSAEAYMEMFINFKLKVEEAYSLKYDTASSFSEEFNAYRTPLAKAYLTDSVKIKEFEKEAYNNLLKDIYVSHILFRTDSDNDSIALEKALAAKKRAKKMDFNKLATEVSEDPSVIYNEGNLGWVTGMTMVYPFEKAAFSLKKGKVSDPIKTNFGYHLIKVHKTRPTRGEIQVAHIFKRKPEGADSAQIDAIRQEMHRIHAVLKNGGVFEDLVSAHSEDKNTKPGGVLPYWVSTGQTNEIFEDAAFALKHPGDFTEVVEAPYGFHIIQLVEKLDKPDYNRWMPQIQTRIRMDERALMVRESFINKTRKEYKLTSQTDSEVLEYANANLEKKYPEFGFLMQEYRDGILLFNISKDQIWDKASKDEAKLKEIYEKGNFDKPYNKVRGIVISKYQDELEKEWIKALREKYTIKVNQDILKSIK